MKKEAEKLLTQHQFGYWEVQDKPSEKELEEYYAQNYFQTSQGNYEKKYTNEELTFFQNADLIKLTIVEQYLLEHGPNEPRKLLDIGCGEGFSMNYFHNKNWDVKGIDYSAEGISKQNPNMLPYFIQGDVNFQIQELISAKEQFDLVLVLNVLEHVINPMMVLEKLKRLLKPWGLLLILVPNDFSALQTKLLAQRKIKNKFWIKTPDHLNYFSANSLKKLAESQGLNLYKCLSDFPIDYFLANPDSNYILDKTKGKNCHNARVWLDTLLCETSIKHTIELYEAFANLGAGRQINAYFKLL